MASFNDELKKLKAHGKIMPEGLGHLLERKETEGDKVKENTSDKSHELTIEEKIARLSFGQNKKIEYHDNESLQNMNRSLNPVQESFLTNISPYGGIPPTGLNLKSLSIKSSSTKDLRNNSKKGFRIRSKEE